jgi:hypothetical protein
MSTKEERDEAISDAMVEKIRAQTQEAKNQAEFWRLLAALIKGDFKAWINAEQLHAGVASSKKS